MGRAGLSSAQGTDIPWLSLTLLFPSLCCGTLLVIPAQLPGSDCGHPLGAVRGLQELLGALRLGVEPQEFPGSIPEWCFSQSCAPGQGWLSPWRVTGSQHRSFAFLEAGGERRRQEGMQRGLFFCWEKVFCRQKKEKKKKAVPKSFKSVVFLEEFWLPGVSAVTCRVQKASCMETCRRHHVPTWVWWLKESCGCSQVWNYLAAGGDSASLILCWCTSGREPAVPLSPCHHPFYLALTPSFPCLDSLCAPLALSCQAPVSKVYSGVRQKHQRCAIFTENQWRLAIKCFHLNLLKMSPVNNKRKAKVCEWARGLGTGRGTRTRLQQELH